jgi:hypothetical protein
MFASRECRFLRPTVWFPNGFLLLRGRLLAPSFWQVNAKGCDVGY